MKLTHLFLVLIIFLGACSSPKKTTSTKKVSPKITQADLLKGGTSFENPVIIKVTTERAGVEEEYTWLSNNYPGYTTIRKTPANKAKKHYDIIRIRTRDGQVKDVYFETTHFFGRW
jgi:hypothetical protein